MLVESLNLLFITIANTMLIDTTKSSKVFLWLTSLLIPIQEIEKFRQKLKTVQTDHTKLQTAYDERVRRYPNPWVIRSRVVVINPLLRPPSLLSPTFSGSKVKGTGWRLNACSLIKLLLSNLLLILLVNDPTHMYLSDLRVYFKVELFHSNLKYDGGVLKSQKN